MPVNPYLPLDVECSSLGRYVMLHVLNFTHFGSKKFLTLLIFMYFLVCVIVIVKGDVPGSLAEFVKAIELDSRQKACRL
jgi:hypothetical protein